MIIDKPIGISSNQVLSKIKRLLKPQKVGHSGTLDPLATGLLPVAFGEATKTIQFIMNREKAYEFEITWGENRDTLDAEGEITETSDKTPSKLEIERIIEGFALGTISQMPPAYSALKVGGKRAYELARKGEQVELTPREVALLDLRILEVNSDKASFYVECGKGFYVRSLARDICSNLGVCGYVSRLRRVKSGNITEKDMISLDYLEKLVHNANESDGKWHNFLQPLTYVLDDILVHGITSSEAAKLKNGMTIENNSTTLPENDVFIVSCEGIPIALCSCKSGWIKPSRVFNL